MYIHRPKSKFPHWVYSTTDNYTSSRAGQKETFEWCKETFGRYGKRWMNAHASAGSPFQGKEFYCYPYRFKSLDDAMAFKLRWS